jgi:hypothetical protein
MYEVRFTYVDSFLAPDFSGVHDYAEMSAETIDWTKGAYSLPSSVLEYCKAMKVVPEGDIDVVEGVDKAQGRTNEIGLYYVFAPMHIDRSDAAWFGEVGPLAFVWVSRESHAETKQAYDAMPLGGGGEGLLA